MKIKRLTIQGFKSFVDRTHFDFPPGTSAIVGPNGCGKSNIVDAIRWVLGEHNARHLRGRMMEDLLFNGSDSRKMIGMAEVSLTLSNEGGLAPARYAEFEEIEVQRRLYRSGESEYLINRVPCRRKDVVDLFTDTGIGTNAYSIIEQGRVGGLVNSKPEERRAYFEEAAGINKFKQKKEASLRRLDATRDNLTRVSDIVAEVKRQLNSLNRQAKKAERYKKFKDELKGYDLFLANLDHERFQEERRVFSKRIEEISDKELALQTSVDEMSARSEVLKVEHLRHETDFKTIRQNAEEMEDKIRSEERFGELLRVKVEGLGRDEERLTREIAEASARGEALAIEIEGLRGKTTEIADALKNIQDALGGEEPRLGALNGIIKRKSEEVSSAEASVISASARLSELKHSMHTSIKEEELLREREAKASTEREDIIRTLETSGEPMTRLRASLEESAMTREELGGALSRVKAHLVGLEETKGAREEELKTAKDEWAKKSARLSTLKEMDESLEGLDNGVKTIIKAGISGQLGGVHGLVSDIIETEPGYEKAVEAVLGERLKYVIVDSLSDGMEAIERLKADHVGRGSFLPVQDARPVAAPSSEYISSLGEGVAAPLSSKVMVKGDYQQVVDNLLADAILVDDLNMARELWKRNGAQVVFVTPEGEMIDRRGVMTGGYSNGTVSVDGVFQKRRQLKEMDVDVIRLKDGVTKLEDVVDKTGEEIVKAGVEMDSMRSAHHAEELGNQKISSELRIHEDESARFFARRAELDAEIEEVRRSLGESAENKASIAAERDALEKSVAEDEAQLGALKVEQSRLLSDKEELSAKVTEIKIEFAGARERIESSRKELSEKEAMKVDIAARLEARCAEIEDGKSEQKNALESMDEIKGRLDEALVERDVVKVKENEKLEEIAELVENIKVSESESSERKNSLGLLQKERGDKSVELREVELTHDNLKERIIEKYGIALDAYVHEVEETDEGQDLEVMKERVTELREKMGSMGEVSLAALDEFKELEVRYNFLVEQQDDLNKSVESLHAAINRINRATREKFKKTFDEINEKFRETFPKFFNGGRAELRLSDETNILDSGIEIVAQPPGKKLQNIMLLSGGEKALTATALIFSIFLIKPSPFCLLDEVDAPLDDVNIERFNGFVKEMSQKSQFILITHNKRTMEVADSLYGITMEEPGVSKCVAVEF